MFVNRYVDNGIKPDHWWIDAGWYDYEDYCLNVGSWDPHEMRFPHGLKSISDHLHDRDMKFILWFTPELVTRGTVIDQTQSQWLLKGGVEWWMGHALIQAIRMPPQPVSKVLLMGNGTWLRQPVSLMTMPGKVKLRSTSMMN